MVKEIEAHHGAVPLPRQAIRAHEHGLRSRAHHRSPPVQACRRRGEPRIGSLGSPHVRPPCKSAGALLERTQSDIPGSSVENGDPRPLARVHACTHGEIPRETADLAAHRRHLHSCAFPILRDASCGRETSRRIQTHDIKGETLA